MTEGTGRGDGREAEDPVDPEVPEDREDPAIPEDREDPLDPLDPVDLVAPAVADPAAAEVSAALGVPVAVDRAAEARGAEDKLHSKRRRKYLRFKGRRCRGGVHFLFVKKTNQKTRLREKGTFPFSLKNLSSLKRVRGMVRD